MKNIILFLFCAFLFACKQNTVNKDRLRAELLNVDKSWSEKSMKGGYYHSRADFISDSSIELIQNAMPLVGKKAILDYTASHPDSTFMMHWIPMRADVAASGDLGYTYGAWTMYAKTSAGNDTILYGDYMTVWQKQADGSWKYLVDGGNDTPQPVEK